MPILSINMSERKRSANWTSSEKRLLLDLVCKHFSIIEDKKVDSAALKQKNAEWVKMSDEYNHKTAVDIHRSAENLRAQWRRLKKYTKYLVKQSTLEPGCIPLKYKEDDPTLKRVMAILGLQLPPAPDLPNQIDNNSSLSSNDVSENHAMCKLELELLHDPIDSEVESETCYETKPVEFSRPPDPLSSQSYDSCSMPMNIQNWGEYTLKLLNSQLNIPLQDSSKPLTAKRNTPESTEPELMAKKKKAIEIQMRFAAEEREEAKKLFAIKYETEKEKLKQEKLKTRLLLSELRRVKQGK